MDLLFYRRGRRRTVHNTNFWKIGFFDNLLWEKSAVDFYEICSVCLACGGLLLYKFL